ncbi:hypothetical protein HPB51_016032 [Rhipicephalus microplus]|uniref:HpcH/HpaI aldolase/citrate lyase domain-containing protein n=1 Tax=Rhipicephalus microplus TaxID=6941 RepID=A0A9J6DHE3_RHIMP|nr:hypothetical protein HPB51_016032 [Rhipicephalus microplus]
MSSSLTTWATLRRASGLRKLLQKSRVPCGSLTLRHYTPRRAVLYVPGSDERKITKAFGLDADCMVLDCEDGVAANKKVRDQVERALGERQHRLELIVCIETALGLLNCHQLLQHASSMTHGRLQMAGLLFGSDDFTASIGARRTPEATEVLMARQQLVVLAKAYGLQAVDMVTIDLKNEELLRRQCAEGAAMGFTGKQVIHPSQIAPTQEAFAPTPAQLDRARRLVEEFHQHQRQGKGAFVFEGSMIDMPSVRQALNIVEADQAIYGKPS